MALRVLWEVRTGTPLNTEAPQIDGLPHALAGTERLELSPCDGPGAKLNEGQFIPNFLDHINPGSCSPKGRESTPHPETL